MTTTTATPIMPASQRFPFRAGPNASPSELEAIRQRIGEAIAGVEQAIYKEARRLFGQDEDQFQECTQYVRITLWRRTLPHFDAAKGNKVSTFLIGCIHRAAMEFLNNSRPKPHTQQWWRRTGWSAGLPANHADTATNADEHGLEALIDAIQTNGQALGQTPEEQKVLGLIIAHPEYRAADIARECGCTRAHVYPVIVRLKQMILALDPHDFAEIAKNLESGNG